uniref:F-box domain-containing protein n=1 Tax=Strongyloides papillosus TaxID=174720 RepID=A0A0N5CC40_STREA
MTKRRSCKSEHLQPPSKKIKFIEENKLGTEKKVENGEEASGQLTAAETVGRNMDLMKLIVRNIYKVKERKNIAKSCKEFNILCNSKTSYVQSYKDKMSRNYKIKYSKNIPISIIFGEIFVINISRYSRSMTEKLEMIRNQIIMNRHIIKGLRIINLPIQYFYFFKELNCFENIKTVNFDVLNWDHIPLRIFNIWENLKPDTLIFGNVYRSGSDYRDSERALHWNGTYTFPKSTKNVHLICKEDNIDWIASALRNFSHYELDSLKLIFGEDSLEFLTTDFMRSVAPIIRYFKKVQFSLHYAGILPSNEYFRQTLGYLDEVLNCDIVTNIDFNVQKCDVDVWTTHNPPIEEENNGFNYNLYENVSIDERYLHMRSVKIISPGIDVISSGLEEIEMRFIQGGLSKMKNLLTLEVYLDEMPKYFDCSKLFCILNLNLKDIKLVGCSNNLKVNDLKTLSIHCPNIENIYLDDIERRDITIRLITSLFKKLKGLHLKFTRSYSTRNVINDLIKTDKTNGIHMLNWPNLNFLCVRFCLPNLFEKILLNGMDKNTPRRPGQFLLRRDLTNYFNKIYAWEITIQKDINCSSIFNDIF